MKTRITDLFGIEHPIIQGAMTWVSFPPLVAAVSNAGGLGILGAAFMSLEELRDDIRERNYYSKKRKKIPSLPITSPACAAG